MLFIVVVDVVVIVAVVVVVDLYNLRERLQTDHKRNGSYCTVTVLVSIAVVDDVDVLVFVVAVVDDDDVVVV